MPAETLKAYFAGIVDGEGCFNIHKNTNRVSYTARAMVAMSDERIINMFRDAYGGSIHQRRYPGIHRKPCFTWYATGSTLERLLTDVMPYLIVKKRQAEICLELRLNMKSHVHIAKGFKGIQHIRPDVLAYRQSLKDKINTLNATGLRLNCA